MEWQVLWMAFRAQGFCSWLQVFPTVKYLRILSRRFLPMPLMAGRSCTLLNEPHDLRICKIFSAVAGPISSSSRWKLLARFSHQV
jgi:hypothetical protein